MEWKYDEAGFRGQAGEGVVGNGLDTLVLACSLSLRDYADGESNHPTICASQMSNGRKSSSLCTGLPMEIRPAAATIKALTPFNIHMRRRLLVIHAPAVRHLQARSLCSCCPPAE